MHHSHRWGAPARRPRSGSRRGRPAPARVRARGAAGAGGRTWPLPTPSGPDPCVVPFRERPAGERRGRDRPRDAVRAPRGRPPGPDPRDRRRARARGHPGHRGRRPAHGRARRGAVERRARRPRLPGRGTAGLRGQLPDVVAALPDRPGARPARRPGRRHRGVGAHHHRCLAPARSCARPRAGRQPAPGRELRAGAGDPRLRCAPRPGAQRHHEQRRRAGRLAEGRRLRRLPLGARLRRRPRAPGPRRRGQRRRRRLDAAGPGYDPATGQYVTTSYRTNVGDPDDKSDDYDDSQLTVVDPGTGDVVNQVRLGGPGDVSLGPSHAGGVAVNGDHVYVVGGGKLYDYDLGEIRSAAPGATVHPSAVIEPPATSYVTVAGGKVYLGKWDKEGKDDEIWVYDIGSDGRPDLSTGSRYDAPAGSNGVAVLPGDRLVFSVNHGRGEAGELESYEVRDGELHGTGSIPVANLPEELIVTPDGRLVGINESGASDYAPWDTDGRDRDGDHGGEDDGIGDTGGSEGTDLADFWARTHLFDLPLGALDGDGFHVEPVTLEQGALQAYGAADGLDGVRTRLTGLHLPTTLLGEVAGADELSTAVDSALATVRSDLRHLAPAADRMGDELKATSSDYSTTDLAAGLVLNLLLTRILG
ncbi:PQQ-binding-like beta-propeller repeat protein [Pimelobacter simplex]|uniref:PQQ-binding-like beta-propeller repeat protein n=1 Tax=Nocardioides simplex TaxID=2045 RepID=A0A7J5E0Q0_NOCSI|nr:PQQ-binding-like beta-propeller repeat protein [Pimelobacter simplex]